MHELLSDPFLGRHLMPVPVVARVGVDGILEWPIWRGPETTRSRPRWSAALVQRAEDVSCELGWQHGLGEPRKGALAIHEQWRAPARLAAALVTATGIGRAVQAIVLVDMALRVGITEAHSIQDVLLEPGVQLRLPICSKQQVSERSSTRGAGQRRYA